MSEQHPVTVHVMDVLATGRFWCWLSTDFRLPVVPLQNSLALFLHELGDVMPVAHKILFVLTLLLPGGFFFGPALLVWLRRQRQRREVESAAQPLEKLLM